MTDAIRDRSTNDILDRYAHETGQLKDDEHLHSGALRTPGAKAHRERNEGVDGSKDLRREAEIQAGEHALEHFAEEGASFLARGVLGGGAVIFGTAFTAYELYAHFYEEPHIKAEEIKNQFINDTMNVALADTLDVPPSFRNEQRALHKCNPQMAATIAGKINADPATKNLLQARADEGFLAAKRCYESTSGGDPKTRGERFFKAMETLGYGERLKNDAAFGKGVELFIHANRPGCPASENVDAVSKRVESRIVPRPVTSFVRG